MLNILAFNILKFYFINFNIPLYNPPNIKTSIILSFHLNNIIFILPLCLFLSTTFFSVQATLVTAIATATPMASHCQPPPPLKKKKTTNWQPPQSPTPKITNPNPQPHHHLNPHPYTTINQKSPPILISHCSGSDSKPLLQDFQFLLCNSKRHEASTWRKSQRA